MIVVVGGCLGLSLARPILHLSRVPAPFGGNTDGGTGNVFDGGACCLQPESGTGIVVDGHGEPRPVGSITTTTLPAGFLNNKMSGIGRGAVFCR